MTLYAPSIAAGDLKGYEVLTYSPIKDYGGWGIRYGRGGKAYNVRGNRGVQLQLANGQRLLIGSQRPEELSNALALAFGKRKSWPAALQAGSWAFHETPLQGAAPRPSPKD